MKQQNNETDNIILQQDLEIISKKMDFSPLKNSAVLITGATGLIGSQIVLLLLFLNRTQNLNIKVVAMGRNPQRLNKKFEKVSKRDNFEFLIGDVQNKIDYKGKFDYIIHGASVTQSKEFVEKPVETILTAIDGTKNMLLFAKEKNVKGFVYLSSMEVFGKTNTDKKLKENDYGYIDILNTRSSYSESKRMVECLCSSFAKEYNLPIKIARLSQTMGPCFNYNDNRMVVQFARASIEKTNITLLTDGSSRFCPIYTSDVILGIFTILLKGKFAEAYTVANSKAFSSVLEMAHIVADEITNREIKVEIKQNNDGKYPPSTSLNLDTSKLENLGWKASVDLKEMFTRVINSLNSPLI